MAYRHSATAALLPITSRILHHVRNTVLGIYVAGAVPTGLYSAGAYLYDDVRKEINGITTSTDTPWQKRRSYAISGVTAPFSMTAVGIITGMFWFLTLPEIDKAARLNRERERLRASR